MGAHLVRDLAPSVTQAELRSEGGSVMPTMVGHFSVFNAWYPIRSAYEGSFVERVAPGAFSKTFAERADQIRVLFDHGADPSIGNKILGVPSALVEDEVGARFEVELHDTSYVRDLLPGLRAGGYGASFRFEVLDEGWELRPERSERNPDGLPERTIREVRCHEFGPVTFPASAAATAGVRSSTHLVAGQDAEFFRSVMPDEVFDTSAALAGTGAVGGTDSGPSTGGHFGAESRRRRLRLLELESFQGGI